MRTKLFVFCIFIFLVFTNAYSQKVKVEGNINMNNRACIHVIDGLISSSAELVPFDKLAHYEQAASLEKLERLGFSNSNCVIVKSTADLDIENYIYRQVHDQVQQIGIQYKIPIVVNGKLLSGYLERRGQLSNLKEEQIKKIKFLDKAKAQAKYGDKVVFGLIEIKV